MKKFIHKLLFGKDICETKVVTVQLPAPEPRIIYSVREDITEDEKASIYKDRGRILEETNVFRKRQESSCQHKKGGRSHDLDNGDWGSNSEYSVIKHVFPWRDMWVICTRCGKKWKPGDTDYEDAIKFFTRNAMSTSITFSGVNVAEARELTKES